MTHKEELFKCRYCGDETVSQCMRTDNLCWNCAEHNLSVFPESQQYFIQCLLARIEKLEQEVK